MAKYKIKGTDTLDHGWYMSPYRIAESGDIKIENGTIEAMVGPIFIKMDKILSVQKIYGPLGIEPWLEIRFVRKNEERRLFICSNKCLGFTNLIGDSLKTIQSEIESCIKN